MSPRFGHYEVAIPNRGEAVHKNGLAGLCATVRWTHGVSKSVGVPRAFEDVRDSVFAG